ncbi:MAG: FAD-dependent oxidoreductase [Gemmatimonadaceae bacterium]
MSTDEAALQGPDLSLGIARSELAENDRLLGHAFGEAVLLSEVGGEVFAISAACSHYGGPLAEGVIDGETVRCPWHHACFSLRTGEALRAPALSPVPTWQVEQRDERLFVTRKIEREPLASTYPVSLTIPPQLRRIVILGAGAAGSAAAEMLRRCGFAGSVTMVDVEEEAPYDRPNLSKDYLAGNAAEEWIPLRPPAFHEERGIEILRVAATRIDVANRHVEVEGHEPIAFDALLLAMGAEPIRLPLPGGDLPHVHYLRSLADSRSVIAAVSGTSRAVVIGGSFIGLEVAASLRARALDVHVVAPEAHPLERVLGPELGAFIKSLHEQKGVVFHLGRTPAAIEKGAVVLDDGSRIDADVVVIGVGVRPRLSLAEEAGLAMDRGIAVDAFLETSAPGIYAAGDVARWPDAHSGDRIRVEHWVVAQRMGQTAARNMLGAGERFAQLPFFWSTHYDLRINYIGHAESWDRVTIDGSAENHDVAVRFERKRKLLALATISRDEESLRTELSMERDIARGDADSR